jgi:hypothetical protein
MRFPESFFASHTPRSSSITTRNPAVPSFGAIGEADLNSHLHVEFRNQVLEKTASREIRGEKAEKNLVGAERGSKIVGANFSSR